MLCAAADSDEGSKSTVTWPNDMSVQDVVLRAFHKDRQQAMLPNDLCAKVKYSTGWGLSLYVWFRADIKGLRWKPPSDSGMAHFMSGFDIDYEDIKHVGSVAGGEETTFFLVVFDKGSYTSSTKVFSFECFNRSQRNDCVQKVEAWVRYVYHASQIVCLDTGAIEPIKHAADRVVAIEQGQIRPAEPPLAPPELTASQMEWVQERIRGVLREAFHHMDINGDGKLSHEEIVKAMMLSPTKQRTPEQSRAEADQFISDLDDAGDKEISFEEWKVLEDRTVIEMSDWVRDMDDMECVRQELDRYERKFHEEFGIVQHQKRRRGEAKPDGSGYAEYVSPRSNSDLPISTLEAETEAEAMEAVLRSSTTGAAGSRQREEEAQMEAEAQREVERLAMAETSGGAPEASAEEARLKAKLKAKQQATLLEASELEPPHLVETVTMTPAVATAEPVGDDGNAAASHLVEVVTTEVAAGQQM